MYCAQMTVEMIYFFATYYQTL